MHSAMRLGRRHAVHDKRTLQLAKYLDHARESTAPKVVDFTKSATFSMYKNDELGDCTCASAGNMIRSWTAEGKHAQASVSDDAVVTAYERVSGYRPGEPETDQGAIELTVLKYWRKKGIGGHKIAAFAAVEIGSKALVREACWLFTGLYAGVALPVSAQSQAVWEVPPGGATGAGAKGSWGGHAVPILGVDDRGLTVVTWGATKRVSWAFFAAYFDEAYACLSNDFLDWANVGPSGFNLAELRRDLASL